MTAETLEARDRKETFLNEAKAFRLRFRCRDCVHVITSTVACSLLFPNRHLRDVEGPFQPDGEWAFCKYFEAS